MKESSSHSAPVSSTASGSSPSAPVSSTASGSSPSALLDVSPIESVTYGKDSISIQYFHKPLGYVEERMNYTYVRIHAKSKDSLEGWINNLKRKDTDKRLAVFKHLLYPNICYVKVKDDKDTEELISILRLYGINANNLQLGSSSGPSCPSSDFYPLPSVSLVTTNEHS